MGKKIAICIGQNEYAPSTEISRLRGCINDALLIGEMLRFAGFEIVRQVHNAAATQDGILRRLRNAVGKLRKGDYLVFWNSSHGYQVRDRSGDELLDGEDEAITTYDTDPRDPLIDDKFAQILSRAHPEATVFIASDSCHSGTLTKEQKKQTNRLPKLWIPPEDILFRTGQPLVKLDDYTKGINSKKKRKPPVRHFGVLGKEKLEMRHVFLSGCKPEEVSWDAKFKQGFHGAMTYHFAKVVLEAWNNNKSITYRDTREETVKRLDNANFDQHPQLEGPDRLKDGPVFGFVP